MGREGIRYDNLTMGDTMAGVISEPIFASVNILGIASFSDTVMELVVSCDQPSACYPKSSEELSLDTVWSCVVTS